jgi:hypothetical protein
VTYNLIDEPAVARSDSELVISASALSGDPDLYISFGYDQ